MSDLGFDTITKNNYYHELLWDSWTYDLKYPEEMVVFNHLMLTSEIEYPNRKNNGSHTKLYGNNGNKYADYIIQTYYPSLYQNYVQTSASEKSYEYYLHVEHIFALTNTSGSVTWSGSVYEAACENANLGNFKPQFYKSFSKALRISSYVDSELTNISNFPHLQAVTNYGTTSAAEIRDHAYGINIISFRDAIPIPEETKPTDPLVGNVPVKKDQTKTMQKIEKVDNVEIYTGYAAQNG